MKYKTIIIANIAEAFEEVLEGIKNPEERRMRIMSEHNLCDRTLLWEGDNKIIITPFPIPPLLLEKNKEVLNFKNCLNIFPKNADINLSEAIIEDVVVLRKLITIIKDNPGINISPYAVTPSFISLICYLKHQNLDFAVKERPAEGSDWTVQYLDSKIGSRTEIDKIKSKNINTPQSVICRNKSEAVFAAKWFYIKGFSCVIKANFGEGGWGIIMIKMGEYKSWKDVLAKINTEFLTDSIWDNSLILVEEYIPVKSGVFGGCPSSELLLKKGYQVTYICDQIVTKDGKFLGITLGKNSLDDKIKNKIRKVSMLVGEKFWKMGYRGFFDIDFVLSGKNQTPYIIETNMRRTGGTHIFDTAKSIFGENWDKKTFIISQDSFYYGKKILLEKVIFEKMKEILFPINKDKKGVIISIINKWQPTFGFIIMEKSSDAAVKMHSKIKNIWNIKN